MPQLSGDCLQEATGRTVHYWVAFNQVSDTQAFFCCAFSEPSCGPFGGFERGDAFEGYVPTGPDCAPIELAIRSRVLSHIERTDFGKWQPPLSNWPGWHGLI